jgi:hypothetical protein
LPEYQSIIAGTTVEHFLRALPDVPALQGKLGQYYELISPRLSDIVKKYPSAKKIVCTMEYASHRREKLKLSKELLRDYPIVWSSHTVFSEEAFALISPYLDRDYFDIAELSV